MIEEYVVPMYKTTDGEVFKDRADAIAHQARADALSEIDAYASQATDNDKYRTRLRSTLSDFVEWRARQAA